MKKFYVDTCIWLDFLEDRKDGLKPLGEFAFQFFRNCRRCGCRLGYSEATLFELKRFGIDLEGTDFEFKDLLEVVHVTKEINLAAKKIAAERKLYELR